MTRQTIEQLDAQIDVLQNKRETVLLNMQAACKHPADDILEVPYEQDSLGGSYHTRPFRVCKLCGLAEQGWGCGYWKLKAFGEEIPRISREKARRDYVLKFYDQEDLSKLRHLKN